MSTAVSSGLSEALFAHPAKQQLTDSLQELKAACPTLSREQVTTVLGQWFHPLHYFPTFLSRLISVTPEIETQTFISRILWQELGEGVPDMAHEKVYISTITDGEFSPSVVSAAPPLAATRKLVEGYEAASREYLSGLGFLYGTEVVDLTMVSTVGELMRRCNGKDDLPWVNIHIKQEPDHIESSNETIQLSFDADAQRRILDGAERMWLLWLDFFRNIRNEILN